MKVVFDFKVDISEELLRAKIPVFALQTLVENAFKHNYFTEKNPLSITIHSRENSLTIWNSIVSLKLTERKGTGLANLTKRYELITGKVIDIQKTETDFKVTIPIIEP